MPVNISDPNILSAILFSLFIWLIVITFLYSRNLTRLKALTKGISKRDLRSIIENIQRDSRLTNQQITTIKKTLKSIQLDAQSHYQALGFMRYNPFSDTGGNQSFCLCLLDRHGDGVVISSLHSRGQTRAYAKKIKGGHSLGYTLSKEERAVIKQAYKTIK